MKQIGAVALFLGVILAALAVFIRYQATGIGPGDSGDLVTAAITFGVPHPPGYPLYTALGHLLSGLPFGTPAWRVGLLSSIPAALTVGLVYYFGLRLTKSVAAAMFGALLMLGNYVFFLYGVTAEVFSLLNMFIVLLITQFLNSVEKPSLFRFSVFAFVFGLSLTHHHMVLFLVPACIAVWLLRREKLFTLPTVFWWVGAAAFIIGLLPYLYVPVAARTNAVVNWDRAVDLPNFIRLATRSDYGSFAAGKDVGADLANRWLQVRTYSAMLLKDFSILGIILAVMGAVWLFRKHRAEALLLSLAFLSLGPGFAFYAGFLLHTPFDMGTFERFVSPSYVLVTVLAAVGFRAVQELLSRILIDRVRSGLSGMVAVVAGVILFVYPVSSVIRTAGLFDGYATDRTAERLAEDYLATVPERSIVLLRGDSQLFTTQYRRYGLGERADTAVVHLDRLYADEYRQVLQNNFPDIVWPDAEPDQVVQETVRANAGIRPVYANIEIAIEEWEWEPEGLLFRVVPAGSADLALVQSRNDELWSRYQDPNAGILSRGDFFLLSHTRDIYAKARVEYGKWLLKRDAYVPAKEQFAAAITLGTVIHEVNAVTLLGVSSMMSGDCDAAIGAYGLANELTEGRDPSIKLLTSLTVSACKDDPEKAKMLYREYEDLRKSSGIEL